MISIILDALRGKIILNDKLQVSLCTRAELLRATSQHLDSTST